MSEIILSRAEVRNCDKVAIEKYQIPGIVLMENAGIAASKTAIEMLEGESKQSVCILAGPGNNGGDGFVVARHLASIGIQVRLFAVSFLEKYKGDAFTNLKICQNMELPILSLDDIELNAFYDRLSLEMRNANLVIDAMLGTGMTSPPREPISTIIDMVNSCNSKILALDIPSGLDCDQGTPLGASVIADRTVTFAAMKKGFQNAKSKKYTGELSVAPIGINTGLLC